MGESYCSIRRWEAQLHAKILAETEVEEFCVIYACQFEANMKDPRSDVYAFFNQRQHLLGKKLPEPMKLRKSLRGGHCELYLLEAIADSETSIEYHDINSL